MDPHAQLLLNDSNFLIIAPAIFLSHFFTMSSQYSLITHSILNDFVQVVSRVMPIYSGP